MNIDDALSTFITEANELLESMESALLRLKQVPDDIESIHAIFRSAHTIKGSAGLFGLDFIVTFTHVAESVLEKFRNGEIVCDDNFIQLFLEVCDHLYTLIDVAKSNTLPDTVILENSTLLSERLTVYLVESDNFSELLVRQSLGNGEITASSQETSTAIIERDITTESDHWHISIRFGQDVLRNGMDPFGFIRYLSQLGDVAYLETILDAVPTFDALNPETCYLGFEIQFISDADIHTIESVFDFVQDNSQIRILPPHSKVNDFVNLIDSLPEADMKLGEILVRCGTLTENELRVILADQSAQEFDEKDKIGQALVNANLVHAEVISAALDKQKLVKDNKSFESNLIRVDANKLDDLINMVGELIIAGAAAKVVAQKYDVTEMLEVTSSVSQLVENVRDSALALRTVQIGATFNRFKRVVHDISKKLGKEIQLEILGEETELDKTVIEKIGDPLTHLVRNSLDHGIEPSNERVLNGKPAYGTLTLNAYHDAGSIMIVVSDDGGGLNREKILAKAIANGLVRPEQDLSDQDIFNLIFEPGFSTAEVVSNLSGRGVGMDVVKKNIQALRGNIEIRSEPGAGTSIFIRLPLTLAIIDGFLVGVEDASYVIPLDMVVECTEVNALLEVVEDSGYLNLRGEVLPYQRLRSHFEIETQVPKRENLVVVRYANLKVGLIVDKLLGEFQTVIKPLGKVFNQINGIGGFTILGSGDVALILDIPTLMQQVTNKDNHHIQELHPRLTVNS